MFSSVSLFFSPLCSCVGQVLFGRIKIVFVTDFFLMKNVLRHGREKNTLKMIARILSRSECVGLQGVRFDPFLDSLRPLNQVTDQSGSPLNKRGAIESVSH